MRLRAGMRPRWWWPFFSCLRRALVGLVKQQMGSSRGGGQRGRQVRLGTVQAGAARCRIGPVRFSNSNSIAAIKEQPGQSRRGKAGTICWWRRRESWEWIGPTVTAETQWPGGCRCCLLGVGAATGRVILLSFTCTLLLSQYWQDWTLLAGEQRFGSSASRPARTVRQPASEPENGTETVTAVCRVPAEVTVPGLAPVLLPKDKYLPPALWGGDLSKVRSGPVLPWLLLSISLWQLGSDLAGDG